MRAPVVRSPCRACTARQARRNTICRACGPRNLRSGSGRMQTVSPDSWTACCTHHLRRCQRIARLLVLLVCWVQGSAHCQARHPRRRRRPDFLPQPAFAPSRQSRAYISGPVSCGLADAPLSLVPAQQHAPPQLLVAALLCNSHAAMTPGLQGSLWPRRRARFKVPSSSLLSTRPERPQPADTFITTLPFFSFSHSTRGSALTETFLAQRP